LLLDCSGGEIVPLPESPEYEVPPLPEFPLAPDYFRVPINQGSVTLDVLANDDPGRGGLRIKQIGYASWGTIALDELTQTVTYTPARDFVGTDTFIYIIERDGQTVDQSAVVEVQVTGDPSEFPSATESVVRVDPYDSASERPAEGESTGTSCPEPIPPVPEFPLAPDFFWVEANQGPTVLDVLANDDPGYGGLRITHVGQPFRGGTVSLDEATQTLIFTPSEGFVGKVDFIYIVEREGDPTIRQSASVEVEVTGDIPASVPEPAPTPAPVIPPFVDLMPILVIDPVEERFTVVVPGPESLPRPIIGPLPLVAPNSATGDPVVQRADHRSVDPYCPELSPGPVGTESTIEEVPSAVRSRAPLVPLASLHGPIQSLRDWLTEVARRNGRASDLEESSLLEEYSSAVDSIFAALDD
jgi:hypothetical protein